MKMSPRNIAMVAYEAQQQALTQLGGTIGLPWEQATSATQDTAFARVLYIKNSLAASGAVSGTFNTNVATAGLSVGSSPVISPAANAGDRIITLTAGTLTGSANPGDTISLTAVWSLVTTGSITTSGSANAIGNTSILLTASTMTGTVQVGESFTISAQLYTVTAPATASGGTCLIPVTPSIQASYTNGTSVTLGNVTVTIDNFVAASSNAVTVNTRGPLPTVPNNTVYGTYTAVGATPGKAQFVFDQVVLSCLDSHGGQ